MGESKRRKATDPNYGKPPEKNRRGLVVSPPIRVEGGNLFIENSSLDAQELRFALLFWDDLVWPSSRAIHLGSGPDEMFLESAKILTRPEYTFWGDGAQGLVQSQIQAFKDRDLAEPGKWALAQGEKSLLYSGGLLQQESGGLLELHRAIPIPKADVPLSEILEFKERRRSELIALRTQIDYFVSEIQGSEEQLDALKKRVAEIDVACADLLKVGKEWQFPVYLSNLKASFSLAPGKLLPALAGGWKIAEPYGLAAAGAVAAAAGLLSTLEIKGDYGIRSIRRPTSPYRYAFLAHRELV